jgi:predicted nucleic acid-binding protein
MIAVADTSPVCYLVLIGEIDLLPKIFSQVLAPRAVLAELLHADSPAAVRNWASDPPPWFDVRETPMLAISGLERLQGGEQAVIAAATERIRFTLHNVASTSRLHFGYA